MHIFRTLYSFSFDIWTAIRTAFFPTVRTVLAKPSILLSPSTLSRVFMDAVWVEWGPGTDANARPVKEKLLIGNELVRGVVLDVGAGHGHLTHYLDRKRVTTYAALEPNTFMHPHIRKLASEAGFVEEDGSLLIVPFGAEMTDKIQTTLKVHYAKFYASKPNTVLESDSASCLTNGQVNTIIAILSFCSVPDAQNCISSLVSNILSPGGALLFYEHVKNPFPDVAFCQRVLGKIWKIFFDGCVLGQDTVGMVRAAGEMCGGWESIEIGRKEGEDEESMFLHATGVCVKKK